MIKTKVAFLESRLLFSQSVQFEKFLKSSDWLEKSRHSKNPLLFSNVLPNSASVLYDHALVKCVWLRGFSKSESFRS